MNIALVGVFVGSLIVTSYRSVPGQTDATPFNTSTGERTSISGVAISQDLLCGACRKLHRRCAHPEYPKKLHYGDCLWIEGAGPRIINDTMGVYKHYSVPTKTGKKILKMKQLNWLDLWMPKYIDEHKFHTKFGITKHKVWKVVRSADKN